MAMLMGFDGEFVVGEPEGQILVSANNVVRLEGNVGRDGAGTPFEMRPRPTEDVDALCDDIREGVSIFCSAFPEIRRDSIPLSVCSVRHPLGAHIHINYYPETSSLQHKWRMMLDLLVGIPVNCKIPAAIFESRLRSGYGQAGDIRSDLPCLETSETARYPSRSGARSEYRTCGGFWGTRSQYKAIMGWTQALADAFVDKERHERFVKTLADVVNEFLKEPFQDRITQMDMVTSNTYDSRKTSWEKAFIILSAMTYYHNNGVQAILKTKYTPVLMEKILPAIKEFVPENIYELFVAFIKSPLRTHSLATHWRPRFLPKARVWRPLNDIGQFQEERQMGGLAPFQFRKVVTSIRSPLTINPVRAYLLEDGGPRPVRSTGESSEPVRAGMTVASQE